jgi:deazaflavin-dependent oxidoreductase (nitroreductase family)
VTDLPDIHALNAGVVREFRANGGKLGGQLEEFTILLLTTTGAKSGLPRLSPMSYFMIDDKMFIIGSFAGVDYDPGWAHNLRANPRAHIEVGTTEFDVIARELPREERDHVYSKMVEMAPIVGEYQARTSRVIPLFELQKVLPS